MTQGNNVAKRLYLWLVVAAVAAVAVLIVVMRSSLNHGEDPPAAENLTITIDQQTFHLRDGVAEADPAPGPATKNTLRIVGEPLAGDATGDGRPDAALLLRNDPGGSGTFYYAVLAINDGGSYHATNALLLGDRIVPRSLDISDGRFVYRFLDRDADQPMSAEPTVERKIVIDIDPTTERISAVS